MFLENLLQALESLRANKMRALLTMLGIIIGIASVITIITLGDSLTTMVSSEMQNMGTNNIILILQQKGRDFSSGLGMMQSAATDADKISEDMIRSFEEKYKEYITEVSYSESAGSGRVKEGRYYADVSVVGVNTGYRRVNNLKIVEGRFINDRDIEGAKNVCVVSDRLVSNVFKNGEDPLGRQIRVYSGTSIKPYTIVGVYKYEESAFSMYSTASERDVQTSLFVPVSLIKKDSADKNYNMITIMANADVDAEWFTKELRAFFRRYYEKNPNWTVSAISMSSQIETVTSMMGTIQTAVAVIAAISLLVGGIGVMNIMLVSVTERTHEIGIRKALGAKNAHIRFQFVTEAVIIALIGGMIGMLLGYVMGILGASLIGAAAAFSLPVMLATMLFSMSIGVFFGYYPANKAAKLDPIDALRYE